MFEMHHAVRERAASHLGNDALDLYSAQRERAHGGGRLQCQAPAHGSEASSLTPKCATLCTTRNVGVETQLEAEDSLRRECLRACRGH